jgi:hypothetical protein
VAHIVALLGRNDLYSETLRALRRLAPGSTGQLLDALLDPELDPSIRQRVPRVLKASPSRRTVDGLLLGLEDASFEVRSQCGLALAEMGARNPGLAVPGEAVLAAVRSALAPGSKAAAGTDAALLDHVFVLLSLVLEREPLLMAATALRSPEHALKGTALEYLDNVLPSDVSALVLARVGGGRPGARRRPMREVLAELSRTSEASRPVGAGLRRSWLRPRG